MNTKFTLTHEVITAKPENEISSGIASYCAEQFFKTTPIHGESRVLQLVYNVGNGNSYVKMYMFDYNSASWKFIASNNDLAREYKYVGQYNSWTNINNARIKMFEGLLEFFDKVLG